LAHLPARTLKTLFAHDADDVRQAGLGNGLDEFRRTLAAVRRLGYNISRGEIDPGRLGIAAPIFDRERAILGSLSLALPAARADEALIGKLAGLTVAGAREIERSMNNGAGSQHLTSARVKIVR
jgi:DNA-binding IclR family transcriptional regulator